MVEKYHPVTRNLLTLTSTSTSILIWPDPEPSLKLKLKLKHNPTQNPAPLSTSRNLETAQQFKVVRVSQHVCNHHFNTRRPLQD